MEKNNCKSIGIALSGGGHRATLFALGALLYLVDSGRNKDVTMISSVSGGSITNAFLTTLPTEKKGSVPFFAAKSYNQDSVKRQATGKGNFQCQENHGFTCRVSLRILFSGAIIGRLYSFRKQIIQPMSIGWQKEFRSMGVQFMPTY